MITWLLKKWVEHLGEEAAQAKHAAHIAMRSRDGYRYARDYGTFHQAFRRHQKWLAIYDNYQLKRRLRKCR